ncbi:uncharacterized protein G2W53_029516 [Senna tora]|uniref:Uncharacterized protein n=1 Tax=Senna tora TaxID=362788 RepID=A0A834T5C8_9FABA|nr:uncharacterized protein G2W53_029516 [Senna tora]
MTPVQVHLQLFISRSMSFVCQALTSLDVHSNPVLVVIENRVK